MNNLLKLLTKKQSELKLSDNKFVDFLNNHSSVTVSRPLWSQTSIGRRPIGITLLRATVQTFPDLEIAVIDYLKKDTTNE
ncbi:hypothetical protein DA01_08140 [Dehalococcoides mccartyi]|jgi:hypothetical protein|uniref:Transcriptional regulator n=1 Tax=Dehalococcoides mccartyi TaxID=61435 RepID=A0A0V8LXW5_9CHLR|nr:hypothetical protein DA01_08140 [Dehalococcoides mccartyi]